VSLFTRARLVAATWVVAFLAVIAGLGAVSNSSPPAAPVVAGVPNATWYWTMVVPPADPNAFVLGTSNGVYRSADRGKTWQQTGLAGVSTTSLVQAGSSIFAGGVPVTPTAPPWVRKGTFRTAPDGTAVLATSTDEGKSWHQLHPSGLPNTSIQSLAVDPAHPTVLYALLNTGGLYRSSDGARSFRLVSTKLGVAPWALAITKKSQLVVGDMDLGSHVSTNGKAWSQAPFTDTQGGRMVMEYAVQPNDPARVLMSSRGIQISTDAGRSWHLALNSQVMFGPVAYTPTKPGVAFAIGFDRSIWRSDDGGKSWKQIAGANASST
jgi:photosystem II stability/assembly factor-like uncharacterized protein